MITNIYNLESSTWVRCKTQKPQGLRCIRHTSQGDGAECNAAAGILMVDQGWEVLYKAIIIE